MNWGARPKLAGAAIGLAVALALSPMGPSLAQTPTPTPTPTPTSTASPSPTPTPTVSPEPTSTPRPSPTPRRGGGDDGKKDPPRRKEPRRGGDTPGDESARRRAEKKDSKDKKRKAERDRRKRKKPKDRKDAVSLPPGPFHTQRLVTRERKLRALGWTRRRIIAKVYAPFIVAGPAAWTDTWGAPRYGPAPGQLRGHEGQDVFCRRGDPVLAAEAGTIEFDEGGLGGKVARLHRRWGGYWYYAHLSDWNTKRFSSGDRVEVGDVIGFCGASGNARGTSPHVHFGLYRKNGRASDPMRFLVEWLRTATRGARGKVERAGAGRLSELNAVTSARLFGDAFTPDLSELDGARRPSWASARNPAADALGLAEIALEAASGDHPGRAASLAKFLDMHRPSR